MALENHGKIEIRDASGRLQATMPIRPGGLGEMGFIEGGRVLVTDSPIDGMVDFRFVYDEDVLRLAEKRTTRDFTPSERRRLSDLLEEAGTGK